MNKKFLPVFLLLFVMPASGTYEMHDFGFGGGGLAVGSSESYAASGIVGEASGIQTSETYDLQAGLQFTRQSNVPGAPTFTNQNSNYNKLHFILNTGDNPDDSLFAVAISDDDFITTDFVQIDGSIAASAVYQSYTDWGGVTGQDIINLKSNTTYKLKVKAIQTKYTESAYSASATAATNLPFLSYDIDIGETNVESAAPYVVAFGNLNLNQVTTAPDKIWIDLNTNADQGGFVYVYTSGNGLTSAAAAHVIAPVSGNLATESEGFGIRVDTASQDAGGPLIAVSPYNGSNDNVGTVDNSSRTILNSSNAPVSNARSSILIKAKASSETPAANDYASIFTLIASATF